MPAASVYAPYLGALLLTIVVETGVALLFGFRRGYEIATVVLINIITNPLLNFLIVVARNQFGLSVDQPAIIALEVAVVLIEWLLLLFALRQDPKKLLALSFAMNLSSYALGVLIL